MLIDRAEIPDLWVIVFNNLEHCCLKFIIKVINTLPNHVGVEVLNHFQSFILFFFVFYFVAFTLDFYF